MDGHLREAANESTGQCQKRMLEMRISLVEQIVMRYPKGMEKFRFYRIEYGGHAESCLVEGVVWLPENANPKQFEDFMQSLQKEKRQ